MVSWTVLGDIIKCDAPGCVRGIVHRAQGFGDPCKMCGGLGALTLTRICKLIDESPSTVRKLVRMRRPMRARIAARICGKIVELTERLS